MIFTRLQVMNKIFYTSKEIPSIGEDSPKFADRYFNFGEDSPNSGYLSPNNGERSPLFGNCSPNSGKPSPMIESLPQGLGTLPQSLGSALQGLESTLQQTVVIAGLTRNRITTLYKRYCSMTIFFQYTFFNINS
jgi:hypothetical protein